MTDTLIKVENVSKKFCRSLKKSLWYGMADLGKELVGRRHGENGKLRDGEFWAVKNLGFEVKRGECLGLIGRNGAGKTTLLRMLSGLIKPDQGRIRIRGQVGALVALGAGFNPILTGRENIFVNAAVLGLSKSRAQTTLDEIVAFAQLDDFIDAPLQTYSSGMAVRLGFSVAAILMKPDILLLDEILAVGDISFRAKCYKRLAELQKAGTALVLVSHDLHAIASICESGLYIKQGRVRAKGAVKDVLLRYEREYVEINTEANLEPRTTMSSSRDVVIEKVFLRNEKGVECSELETGKRGEICITCHVGKDLDSVSFGAIIYQYYSQSGSPFLSVAAWQDENWFHLSAGQHELQLSLSPTCLPGGCYSAKISVTKKPFGVLAMLDGFRFFVIHDKPLGRSVYYQPRKWLLGKWPP